VDGLPRVGYRGRIVGEDHLGNYETELQTLAAWMQEPQSRE
jgi:hypothetical protein